MKLLVLTAEHESISTVLGNSLTILVAFILLLVILSKVAIGPALQMMEKRQQEVNDQLDQANIVESTAKLHEQTAKDMIHHAQIKAQDLVAKAKEAGDKIKEDASRLAREESIRIRQEATHAMQHERDTMLAELTTQIGDLSVELTKTLLKRDINEQDHQRLIEDFIEGLDH